MSIEEKKFRGRGDIYGDRGLHKLESSPRFKEVNNRFTGEIKKFATKLVNIPYHELETKTAKAKGNRRNLEGVNVRKLDLFNLLKDQRVISNPAIGYTLAGDPTIYLIDGWTRRAVIMELAKNEEAFINLPVEVMNITEDDLWVVTALVYQSNTNTPHNNFEKSELMLDFYQLYAAANPESTAKDLYMSVGSSTLKSPNYGDFKAMLFLAVLTDLLKKQEINVLPKVRTIIDAKHIIKWLESQRCKITISKNRKCVQYLSDHLAAQIQPHLEDIVLRLDAALNAKEAFTETKEVKEESEASCLEINKKACSFNLNVNRSDLTPEAMEKVYALFKEKEKELQDLLDRIENILKEEAEATK
ncbi:hypothetical protein [Marinomonas fungiae]|uniref:Uncharacterized protein n=1 Tax=Marinomonas fungiae TaxID=1137284 RepID=A0A0K6IUE5_9GAMM|nr:hypothetical protein [Marinomonas fungiae]CUB06708.1 hypothetical protein Ga0061065_12124 [Marinomonas fungiae]